MKTESHDEKIDVRLGYTQFFRHFGTYLGRRKTAVIGSVVLLLLATACSRAIPWVIGLSVEAAFQKKDGPLFLQLAWAFLIFEALKILFTFSSRYAFELIGNRIIHEIRQDLFRHVLSLPLDYFNKTPAGRTVTRMTHDVGAMAELFSSGVVGVFIQFVFLGGTLLAMALISPRLTLLTLLTLPFFVWLTGKLTARVKKDLHEEKRQLSALNAFLAENLNGMKVVQLTDQSTKQIRRFEAQGLDYRRANLSAIHHYGLMQPVLNGFSAVLMTSALFVGAGMTLDGAVGVGALVTFLMYTQDFIPPIREILEKYQFFQNSLASAERVFSLLGISAESEPATEAALPERLQGRLEWKDLTFRYADRDEPALQGIDLTVPAGSSLALVGRTGSGKSTMVSLLQRFYDAPEGRLFIDGIPIEAIPRRELRRRIGVVQQDPVLFRGTVESNITMNVLELPSARLEEIRRRLGLRLELRHPVEEKGKNLSLGEKQLIAFARILAFDPQILILDEATAHVDSESERLLQEATLEVLKGRTSVLIAHRLSTIQHCDQIAVLQGGRLMEKGSHAELLRAGGVYSQLASAGSKSTTILALAPGTADP